MGGDEQSTNKIDSLPTSLTVLDSTASIEQLKAALKIKPPDCAGIASKYQCGNHDSVPQYSGPIVAVNTGDELAMNSFVISVVDIDGSGNGNGLVKMPMMNNIKLGVKLENIKVAKGGCIVAGQAVTSGISVSVLNEQQRQKLHCTFYGDSEQKCTQMRTLLLFKASS